MPGSTLSREWWKKSGGSVDINCVHNLRGSEKKFFFLSGMNLSLFSSLHFFASTLKPGVEFLNQLSCF